MIRGIHGLLCSTHPEATRVFFGEPLRLSGSDLGEGWWIFDFAEGELGVHRVNDPGDAELHAISITCDDIEATLADLKSRGVRFTHEVETREYGSVTEILAPGGVTIPLYEPRYVKHGPSGTRARRRRATQAAESRAKRSR